MKICLSFLFLLCLSVDGLSQKPEARLVDEFSRFPCGDIMGRLDVLLAEWTKNTSEQIAVIYYGQRYRRSFRYDSNNKPVATILEFAHPEDGLNWAKGIPDYMSLRVTGGRADSENREFAEKIRTNLKLIDGGYRSELFAQIWIVPSGADPPKPEIQLTRDQINFGAKSPRPIPRYYYCYDGL